MFGKLFEKYDYYTFDETKFIDIHNFSAYDEGFVLKLSFKNISSCLSGTTILRTKSFELSYHKKSIFSKKDFTDSEKADRVWIYGDDGSVDLLEMKMKFTSSYTNETREMIVELVLNKFPIVNKDIYFVYNVTNMFWVYDNEVVNSNSPFGYINLFDEFLIENEYLKFCQIAKLECLKCVVKDNVINKNMAFYSPRGYNTWIGDVVNFYHNGTYHVICFRDRHHHSSRWGGGAHTMYHITTKDFRNWYEHGALIELDEQWKTVGTGTMFYHEGKYYFTHGWHTSRMVPVEKTSRALFEEPYLRDTFSSINYEEIRNNGLVPSGAAYLVSDDGINFTPGNIQFHIAENPSVFVNSDNKLVLYAGYGSDGCWIADEINGPWSKVGNLQMTSGKMGPSTECPSMFELNGYKYLIAGRTGFWKTEYQGEELIDEAINGNDVYDGLFVPMVTKTDTGRLIYGGWLEGYGWGSLMIHRELIQADDGRLYMKWLPELAPSLSELEEVSEYDIKEKNSYYFEALASASSDGKIGIKLTGNKTSVLYIDVANELIQISNVEEDEVFPQIILPAYQSVQKGKNVREISDIHYMSHNFSIGKVSDLTGEFKIKLIIYYEEKFNSYIIDAEIAERRTIISNRTDELFDSIAWVTQNVSLLKTKLFKFKKI